MSKCRPKLAADLRALLDRGVKFELDTDLNVLLQIPYDALLKDPDVQRAFQGLVRISSEEEERRTQGPAKGDS